MPGGRSRSDSVTTSARPAAGDHDPVHLDAVDEPLEDALLLCDSASAAWRWRSRSPALSMPEDAALPAGVGRLQHGGQADRRQRAPAFGEGAHGGERRLRHALLGERAPHHDLVAHPLRDCACRSTAARAAPSPPRRPGPRDRRTPSARRRPRARRATSVTASTSVKSTASATSATCMPERVRVAVDPDDAQALLARLQDRAALVAPRADEEDGLHSGRC